MEFFEAIEKRHSYRGQYEDKPVPEEDLIKIVNAGLVAPSGCNAQTTSFIIVTNKEIKEKIAKIFASEASIIVSAPALIIGYTKKLTFDFGLDCELEDYAAAIENILLAITAMGYASVWVDGNTRLEGRDKAIAQVLDVPKEYNLRAVLPVGVPKTTGKRAPKKPFDERVRWVR